ncbi:hypothetical protein NV226_02480 [Mycoplasma iguanae]|uniref:Uncharacterized protein n=1 Tax=Mycoplasma iguanae TaxID=292461 RepID=A0ABY5RAD1_9MOLU|nr:hypothetical protein [Mycoplasma iguanae]UVD81570.1 hypothetical protein NV226_02480 [Mycoplasma iguanae]
MEMWIILAVLLGAIVFFFFFQWFSNIRKRKKQKKLNEQFLIDQEKAKFEIIATISTIIEQNQKHLDNFVVSVGLYKMSDINNFAKESLKKIQQTKNYNLFVKNEDFPILQDLDLYLNNLSKTKSNLWSRNCIIELEYFQKQKQELENRPDFQDIKNNTEILLKEQMEKFIHDTSK